MIIETYDKLFGGTGRRLKAGLVKGRNWLVANGYSRCQNQMYYTNGVDLAHYNHRMKMWIIENAATPKIVY